MIPQTDITALVVEEKLIQARFFDRYYLMNSPNLLFSLRSLSPFPFLAWLLLRGFRAHFCPFHFCPFTFSCQLQKLLVVGFPSSGQSVYEIMKGWLIVYLEDSPSLGWVKIKIQTGIGDDHLRPTVPVQIYNLLEEEILPLVQFLLRQDFGPDQVAEDG